MEHAAYNIYTPAGNYNAILTARPPVTRFPAETRDAGVLFLNNLPEGNLL